jgi:pimeloyl-ACP methyl ester carboxylesterase
MTGPRTAPPGVNRHEPPTRHVEWAPDGFDEYRSLYPETGPLNPPPDRAWTRRFVNIWREGAPGVERWLRPFAKGTTVVFVRGYLGHYMPLNLTAPCAALDRLGFDAFVARNQAGGTVSGNVARIVRHLDRRPVRDRLVFCGHSRGGLECLTLLARHPHVAGRCAGVALSQAPHGPSFVMESVLNGSHGRRGSPLGRRAADTLQRAGLTLLGARPGGHELTPQVWPALVAAVDEVRWPFCVIQTASWSSRPTAWLDSFHGRLGEIGPGRAHDGQFFLEDLVWPSLPHVLLPHLDHAQPAVGGLGFDHTRYWLSLLRMVLA